jgi:hypothetical protein
LKRYVELVGMGGGSVGGIQESRAPSEVDAAMDVVVVVVVVTVVVEGRGCGGVREAIWS